MNTLKCEKCNFMNEGGARFCEMCGHPLSGAPIDTSPPSNEEVVGGASQDYQEVQPPEQDEFIPPQTPADKPPRSKVWIFGLLGCSGLLVILCVLAVAAVVYYRYEIPFLSALFSQSTIDGTVPLPPELADEQDIFEGYEHPSSQATELPIQLPSETQPPSSKAPEITVDRNIFYCVPSDGATSMTINVSMDGVGGALAVRWHLKDKIAGTTTDWEEVDMQNMGSGQYSYTFDANTWEGTNNFYYPPMMHESWFEFQIVAKDGSFTSELFQDNTFRPCAQ
ncbi:MAG: zinc ribbon domain-containing protein [Anaerolineales bacterium]|nr:zinc ribbon domain-containing protein [Anaerolineales bacterium]